MKKILYIVLCVILLSFVVTLSISFHAAPHPDPTPTSTPEAWLSAKQSFTKNDPGGNFGNWQAGTITLEADAIGMITTIIKSGPRKDVDIRDLAEDLGNGDWPDAARVNDGTYTSPVCFESQGSGACSKVGFSGTTTDSSYGFANEGDSVRVRGWYQWGTTDTSSVWTVTVQFIYEGDGCEDPDPTELPVAASGTLAGDDDTGDHHNLVEETEYFIYTSGGPWNDGEIDRYDIAVSWDEGETWEQLGSGEQFEGVCSYDYSDHSAFRFTADADHSTIDLRVNDVDGDFGDNTGDIDYTIATNEGSGGLCSNYYSAGSLIQSGTVDADEELGSSMSVTNRLLGPMYAYDTYLIKILDPWQEGDGTDQLGTEMQEWSTSFWEEMATFGDNTCEVEYAASKDIYFIGPSEWGMYEGSSMDGAEFYIRAEDIDGLFTDNTGTFDWQLLGAEYTAPESDCASAYQKGPLMETPVLHSSASNGVQLPYLSNGFTPGQVYVLENVDSANAYYTINGTPHREFEISPDGDTWYEMGVFADCVNPLDHFRNEYYFVADQTHYYFRTSQGLPFIDTVQGSLALNLYGASDVRPQPGETCSDVYSTDTEIYSGTVDSSDSAGEALGSLLFEEGEIYSIFIDDPAYDHAGSDAYDADIHRYTGVGGPSTYQPFESWDGALCYEEEGGKGRLYFEAQQGRYEIRAAGPHEDNTGDLSFTIYSSAREAPINSGCEVRDYGDVDYWYPAVKVEVAGNDNNPDDPGELIANELTSSYRYKIEVSNGPAYLDHGSYGPINPSYDIEISTNNGGSWMLLEDYLDCVVEVGDYIRGYFSPAEGEGPFRVRVYDPDNSYINNGGSLDVELWAETNEDPEGPYSGGDPEDPSFPSGWGEGCTAVCVRPGSWLQVGQWVEYIRCRFTRYISWCPYHTDRLFDMREGFYQVEPFGTMMEVVDSAQAVQREVASYQWTDEGGGGADTATVQAPRHFVFAPGEGGGADIPLVGEDTIWGSGDIDLTPGGAAYSTECNNLMADSLGDRLAMPLCFTFNVVDQLGLKTWFQWIWDIAMLAGLLMYIGNRWVDLMT